MLYILPCILPYIAVIIGFCWWDAAIGMPIDWDGYTSPPVLLAAIFWPLSLPITFISMWINYLGKVKEKRIAREQKQKQLRVAIERETQEAMVELDQDIKRSKL